MKQNFKIWVLFFSVLVPVSLHRQLNSEVKNNKSYIEKNTIKWQKINVEKQYEKKNYLGKNRK